MLSEEHEPFASEGTKEGGASATAWRLPHLLGGCRGRPASGDIRQMYKAPPGRVLETKNASEFRLQDLEATESPGMSSVTSCAWWCPPECYFGMSVLV